MDSLGDAGMIGQRKTTTSTAVVVHRGTKMTRSEPTTHALTGSPSDDGGALSYARQVPCPSRRRFRHTPTSASAGATQSLFSSISMGILEYEAAFPRLERAVP